MCRWISAHKKLIYFSLQIFIPSDFQALKHLYTYHICIRIYFFRISHHYFQFLNFSTDETEKNRKWERKNDILTFCLNHCVRFRNQVVFIDPNSLISIAFFRFFFLSFKKFVWTAEESKLYGFFFFFELRTNEKAKTFLEIVEQRRNDSSDQNSIQYINDEIETKTLLQINCSKKKNSY